MIAFMDIKSLKFPLHFIVGYDGAKPVGLLPLQLNTGKGPTPDSYGFKKNFLEFFGGDDMDSNKVFVKEGYEFTVPQFLQQIHDQSVLAPLAEEYKINNFQAQAFTTKYVADLKEISQQSFLMEKVGVN